MELKSAICPACKREIEVNSLEEVDFCKLCGKPFAINDAINLYTERVERDAAAKKPSDGVIAKFNAILAQDYKLAQRYLDDIVRKEYPKLPLPYSLWHYEASRFANTDLFHLKDRIKSLKTELDKTEEGFKNLYSLNPQIAEMYYKLFCEAINALFNENRDLFFTRHLKYCPPLIGDLPFLKLRLIDLEDRVRYAQDDVIRYEFLCGKEFDDVYISATISQLPFWGKEYCRKNSYVNTAEINKDVKNLISCLEKFLSPTKKAEQRAKETREQEEKKKKKLEKELAFWREYIELLKAGKTKAALVLLKKKKKPSQTDEFAKFKKGLFTVKYKGDVALLNAETLAENSAAGNAKSSGKEKDSTKS